MKLIKRRIKTESFQYILDCFTELTGIRVAYIINGKEVLTGKYKENCSFCSEIRKIPGILDGCLSCDRTAFIEAEKRKSLYLYQCHIGLWEAVVPLLIKNTFAGCLMLGQVRNRENARKQWEYTQTRLLRHSFSMNKLETLRAEFVKIKQFSNKKIEAAASMLEIMILYIINSELIQVQEPEAIDKALQYIKANYNRRFSAVEIAEIAGLSTSYTSYLFHKETGYTITAYVEKLRIEASKERLLESSLSIKQIAAEAGFSDQNYFSRAFKKYTGISPSKYKNKINCQIKLTC